MIIAESLTIDGRELVRHYSDAGMKIRQLETGVVYDDSRNTGTVNVILPPSSAYVFGMKNIASDKTVEVSSGNNGNALTDGDITVTAWSSAESDSANGNAWVTVDLESVCAFNQISIAPGIKGEGFPKDFTISVSNGGEEWETVASYTEYSVSDAEVQNFVFDTVHARYVKLEASVLGGLSNGKYGVQLTEIEIYNNTSESKMDFDFDGDVDVADVLTMLGLYLNKRAEVSLLDVVKTLTQAVAAA